VPVSASSPAADLATPEVTFLMALWAAWQALSTRGEAELRARHGLDLRGFIALAYVQGGTRQPAALARELNVPRYEISRVLSGLEARGAVVRAPGGPDARRVSVTATPAGQALWQAALGTVRDVTGPPLTSLDPAALATLTRTLAALAHAARPEHSTQETAHDHL
jgi:DNA-binding MarR family transcriptional regulator